jgi:hypothetical protein
MLPREERACEKPLSSNSKSDADLMSVRGVASKYNATIGRVFGVEVGGDNGTVLELCAKVMPVDGSTARAVMKELRVAALMAKFEHIFPHAKALRGAVYLNKSKVPPGVTLGGFDDAKQDKVALYMDLQKADLKRVLTHHADKGTACSTLVRRAVMEGVCLAVLALHRSGVCHLDIKASNILLSKEWRVFLTGFAGMQPTTEANRQAKYRNPHWRSGAAGADLLCVALLWADKALTQHLAALGTRSVFNAVLRDSSARLSAAAAAECTTVGAVFASSHPQSAWLLTGLASRQATECTQRTKPLIRAQARADDDKRRADFGEKEPLMAAAAAKGDIAETARFRRHYRLLRPSIAEEGQAIADMIGALIGHDGETPIDSVGVLEGLFITFFGIDAADLPSITDSEASTLKTAWGAICSQGTVTALDVQAEVEALRTPLPAPGQEAATATHRRSGAEGSGVLSVALVWADLALTAHVKALGTRSVYVAPRLRLVSTPPVLHQLVQPPLQEWGLEEWITESNVLLPDEAPTSLLPKRELEMDRNASLLPDSEIEAWNNDNNVL